MRLLALFVPPLLLAFAACGGNSDSSADAGTDAGLGIGDASDEFAFDAPFLTEAAAVTQCKLSGNTDPVGLCVQQAALKSLHEHAFALGKGVAASWDSNEAGAPDPGDGGVVTYSVDATVAYAAAASSYLASAELYGDTTINAALTADLQGIALQLETSFPVAPTEYSGELYFHLRTAAAGLRAIQLNTDGAKFDKLADTYGRSLLTAHYFPLGTRVTGGSGGGTSDAGHTDAGSTDAGAADAAPTDAGNIDSGPKDAGAVGDAHVTSVDATVPVAVLDGIFGNSSGGVVTYATADVATAAYALLDMVARYPMDPLASPTSTTGWLAAARASLAHLQAQAIEPTTGLFYTAMQATKDVDGSETDTLAPSTNPAIPNDAVLADTNATFALTMVRAQYLVTSSTVVSLTGLDGACPSTCPVDDAGVKGPFISVLDLPLEAWADTTMKAMNGAHSLWDTGAADGGSVRAGYMDGYVPSTNTFITTKSTRPNAFMAGAIARGLVNLDPTLSTQLPVLVQLLISNSALTVLPNSNLITVLPLQQAYLVGATQAYQPLTTVPNPTSYSSNAVSAAVEGLTEQLFGQTH